MWGYLGLFVWLFEAVPTGPGSGLNVADKIVQLSRAACVNPPDGVAEVRGLSRCWCDAIPALGSAGTMRQWKRLAIPLSRQNKPQGIRLQRHHSASVFLYLVLQ